MNILLTGASGFIGSNIYVSLHKNYRFFVPSHKQLDLLNEDAVLAYFRKHHIDTVIHCAVIGGYRKDQYAENMFYDNLRIFFNLVRCKKYFTRMINIGSGAVYDKRYPIKKVKEEEFGKHIPNDPYGLYKYICADYINHSKQIVDLRVFGLFGEGEDYRHRFISNTICRVIYELPIMIKQNVVFDFLDIEDFVKVLKHFIGHVPNQKAYNVGSERQIDLLSIANMITSQHGRKNYPVIIKKRGLSLEYTCDTKRLCTEIPSMRPIPLSESLERLSDWYKKHKKIIKKSEL